jgi:Zn-dependent peptidase ImmA (M78 family)
MPPIPIEDIAEKYLKLQVEFDDLHSMFGVPRDPESGADILGAVFFDERRVVIDESLDPELHPNLEGRYRFMLAHDATGHWRLHRHLFSTDALGAPLLRGPDRLFVVCRSSQAKERIEWQADYYASCVLMPRNLLVAAWCKQFGNKRIVFRRAKRLPLPFKLPDDLAAKFEALKRAGDDQELERFVQPLADEFKVSRVAMRIRVEEIGLLRREAPSDQAFNAPV